MGAVLVMKDKTCPTIVIGFPFGGFLGEKKSCKKLRFPEAIHGVSAVILFLRMISSKKRICTVRAGNLSILSFEVARLDKLSTYHSRPLLTRSAVAESS